MDPEELARLEAEEAAKAAAKEAEDAAKAKEAEDAAKAKLSDREAELLKEVMKNKTALKAAKEAADTAASRLKEFEGLDPAELRKLLAQKAEADRKEAEKRGEYDRIITQVKQDADAREAAAKSEADEARKQLQDAQRRIDDLTVGSAFRGSKFISEETVLSGDKARRLYADYFEIEDGQTVAYDKPRGASDRTPLVDTRTGSKLGFEAAIEKIIKEDPDYASLAKSKLKPGSGSGNNSSDKGDFSKKPALSGVSLIAANLSAMKKTK